MQRFILSLIDLTLTTIKHEILIQLWLGFLYKRTENIAVFTLSISTGVLVTRQCWIEISSQSCLSFPQGWPHLVQSIPFSLQAPKLRVLWVLRARRQNQSYRICSPIFEKDDGADERRPYGVLSSLPKPKERPVFTLTSAQPNWYLSFNFKKRELPNAGNNTQLFMT